MTVVEHGRRQTLNATKLLLQVVSCQSKRIVRANSISELNWVLHIRHRVELEADNNESLRAVLIDKSLIARHLLLAGLAPSRPEINEDDLPTELSGRNKMSLQILQ